MSLVGHDSAPSATAALAKVIGSDVYVIHTLDYISTACFAVLIWDWLICLEDERRLIWNKKLTGASWFYIFFRVYSFIFQCKAVIVATTRIKNLTYCTADMAMAAVVEIILVFATSSMIQGRIYALYSRSKVVLRLNVTVWLMCLATVIAMLSYHLTRQTIVALPPPLTGCVVKAPPYLWTSWIPTILMELVFCAEVIFKTLQNVKWVGVRKTKGDLFALMVRDYATWFTVSTAITITNLLLTVLAPNGYKDLALPFYHSVTSVTGCHLILNLKEEWYHETPGKTEATISHGFQFASAGAAGPTTGLDTTGVASEYADTALRSSTRGTDGPSDPDTTQRAPSDVEKGELE